MSTVRPVKRLDAANTEKASETFVGSIKDTPARVRRMSVGVGAGKQQEDSPGSAGGKLRQRLSRRESKETLSDSALAGRTLVDDVVLPVISKVCLSFLYSSTFAVEVRLCANSLPLGCLFVVERTRGLERAFARGARDDLKGLPRPQGG
jgi:hypothetical protein